MKILILGGTGFVGSYLYNNLKNKHAVDYSSTSNINGLKYNAETDLLRDVLDKKYDIIINNINPLQIGYSAFVKSIVELISLCKETNSWLIQVSSLSAQAGNRNMNSYNLKKAICDDIIMQELPNSGYTILRFSQLFDKYGLARESQSGLYYLLDSIKTNKPISLFSNYRSCVRNYLPIELLLLFFDKIIDNHKTGLFNSYIDDFTLNFPHLINELTRLNPKYNKENLISVGKIIGLNYSIERQSDELVELIDTQSLISYFKQAYNQINE